MNKMYFISGVSGVGKSAIIPHLKTILPDMFEVRDFDERGVPGGADHKWRLDETRYWISIGESRSKEGKTLVVCGFSNPDEIQEILKDFPNFKVKIVLLDGKADIIEQRLRARNTNPETRADLERAVSSVNAFIENNTKFVPILREICQKHSCPVVDTSHKDSLTVAQEVSSILQ